MAFAVAFANRDFYPRPLRRGRRVHPKAPTHKSIISIHALFAEGDHDKAYVGDPVHISIHALFAEGDRCRASSWFYTPHFYPRPLRRGRPPPPPRLRQEHCISIHALFAEGDAGARATDPSPTISIHALFAEGDPV